MPFINQYPSHQSLKHPPIGWRFQFAVLLGVIFILELAAGIASYVLRYDVEDIVMKQTKDGMLNYNTTGSEGVSLTWDRMQRDVRIDLSHFGKAKGANIPKQV